MAPKDPMDNTPISYYELLEVSPAASDEDIKRAYRQMAMRFHPDRNPQNRKFYELRFRAISEAYAGLKTRDQRLRYNRLLRSQGYALNDNSRPPPPSWLVNIVNTLWPHTYK